MKVEQFQEMVAAKCAELGVELVVSPGGYVESEGNRSNGYFNEDTLAYCTGRDFMIWFPVAVHEFNHMMQWAEQSPFWLAVGESDKAIWPWMAGEIELESSLAREYVFHNMRCELDCERRTIKMARELGLPGDWDLYTKMANSYIYFYHLMAKHRKWYQMGKEPYVIPEILAVMPDHLEDDHETITPELIALYEKHLPYLLA